MRMTRHSSQLARGSRAADPAPCLFMSYDSASNSATMIAEIIRRWSALTIRTPDGTAGEPGTSLEGRSPRRLLDVDPVREVEKSRAGGAARRNRH